MAQAESGGLRTESPRLDLFPALLLTTVGARRQRASNIARSMALLQTPEELCRREVQVKAIEGDNSPTLCHWPDIWLERAVLLYTTIVPALRKSIVNATTNGGCQDDLIPTGTLGISGPLAQPLPALIAIQEFPNEVSVVAHRC